MASVNIMERYVASGILIRDSNVNYIRNVSCAVEFTWTAAKLVFVHILSFGLPLLDSLLHCFLGLFLRL